MMISLVKYNLAYYVNSLKFIPPGLVYIAFVAINYSFAPQMFWDSLNIGVLAIFILANINSRNIVNNEDIVQQHITRKHVRNDLIFHTAKIISIQVFMLPFYLFLVFFPLLLGMYTRSIGLVEVLVSLVVYFLFSLMGSAMGLFFNEDLHMDKSFAAPLHLLLVIIVVVPFATIYQDNIFVVTATYLLPPLHFLQGSLLGIGDAAYNLSISFWIFIVYAIGYSTLLMVCYVFINLRKSKR